MYFTTHVLVGAALGAGLGNPLLAFPAGALSHIALDAVPHNDYRRLAAGVIDFFAGLAVLAGLMAWRAHAGAAPLSGLLWGALGGGLPDLEVALAYLRVIPRRFRFPSHSGLTRHRQTRFWPGMAAQGAAVALALLLVAIC